MAWETAATVITNFLLFFLVMGMASTVDIRDMRAQLRNVKAVSIGLFCQFFLLPFLVYIVVVIFSLPPSAGVTLIIVVSSPGGSYSNWWCSILNADLALSVSMTTASTILSLGFLPLNLFLYSYAAYGKDETASGESVFQSINFGAIFISLGVVVGAIGTGIICSWKFDTPRWHRISYLGGNVSGISLILFSTVLSFVGGSDGSDPTPTDVADSGGRIHYVAICLPCIFGLAIATALATVFKLQRPERLTTAVECCYQNTGIATSAALSLFEGEELKEAMRVPVVYGFVEALSICIFLFIGWKVGWSKAPKDERFCTVITKSYELHDEEKDSGIDNEEGGSAEVDKNDSGDDEWKSNEEQNNDVDTSAAGAPRQSLSLETES